MCVLFHSYLSVRYVMDGRARFYVGSVACMDPAGIRLVRLIVWSLRESRLVRLLMWALQELGWFGCLCGACRNSVASVASVAPA